MSYCMVSSKVYNILTKYRLGKHKFFNTRTEDMRGDSVGQYRFFYQEVLDWDVIDFSECEFTTGNDYDGYKAIPMKSKEEFLENRFVNVKRVALTNKFENADMFKLKLPVGILISLPLYQELHSANVTGIKFNEIEVKTA